MKKTISINIGGNIFHIEEEGYNKLKSYLDSVHDFFSTYEDSKEITDDIENRIAEKFYTELKKNKEAVSAKQIDELISSMGTVEDFGAILDDDPLDRKQADSKQNQSKQSQTNRGETKKLYRNANKKILGGVASGIAHYFSIDPIWIRLLWVLFTALFGIGFIAYIVFWIMLPESDKLEDKHTGKKFFRNPDERVLGGVASGISSYFGIDTVVVRIIFIISIFIGGSGLILYIILWIIMPEAKSVTEKMEMKGEPVTMQGIEKNVKKMLKVEEGDETLFVKILLFPFRLIAIIFEGVNKMMGPVLRFVLKAVRLFFGSGVFLIGFVIMISLILASAVILGLGTNWDGNFFHIHGFPISHFLEPFNSLVVISAFFVCFIPAFGISLLGLTLLLKRRIENTYVDLSMLLIWILAIIGCSFSLPKIVGQFSADATYERELIFAVTDATPRLMLNELEQSRGEYEGVDLRLRGHDDSVYLVVIQAESWGSSQKNARSNAEAVKYNVERKGNDFFFDPRLSFATDAKFRFQNIDVTLYIPYGKEFKIDQDIDKIIINTMHLNGYYGDQMGSNRWVFGEDGLDCTTCEDDERGLGDYTRRNSFKSSKSFDFYDFDEVKVSAEFRVKIYQNDKYEVKLQGRSRDLKKVYIQQSDDRLTIRSKDDGRSRYSKEVTVHIYMPRLAYFRASGKCRGDLKNFDNSRIELDLSGEADFNGYFDTEKLVVDLSGNAKLNLRGDSDEMLAEVSGVAYLNSTDLDVKMVTIDASGKSNSEVYADRQLTVDASGKSQVEYSGTDNVSINEKGNSRVRKK